MQLNEKDVKMDVYTSGINCPAIVCLTHLPTGCEVQKEGHGRNRLKKELWLELEKMVESTIKQERTNMEEKVVEVLAAKITQLEEENEALQERVTIVEGFANYGWLLHKMMSPEENGDLPLPRLEMRFERKGDYGYAMTYGIVRKHYVDGIEFIPLSLTTTSGGADQDFAFLKKAILAGKREAINAKLPFRDGVHIKYDSMSLNMPIVIRCEECTYVFSVSEEDKKFINDVLRQDAEKLD